MTTATGAGRRRDDGALYRALGWHEGGGPEELVGWQRAEWEAGCGCGRCVTADKVGGVMAIPTDYVPRAMARRVWQEGEAEAPREGAGGRDG